MKTVIFCTQAAPNDGYVEYFFQHARFDQVLHYKPNSNHGEDLTASYAIAGLKQYIEENQEEKQIDLKAIVISELASFSYVQAFLEAFPFTLILQPQLVSQQDNSIVWNGNFSRIQLSFKLSKHSFGLVSANYSPKTEEVL